MYLYTFLWTRKC